MKYWTLVYCFTKKLSKLAEGEQDKNFNIILDCLKKSVQLNSKFHKLKLYTDDFTYDLVKDLNIETKVIDYSRFRFIDDIKIQTLPLLEENEVLIDPDIFLYKKLDVKENYDLILERKDSINTWWYNDERTLAEPFNFSKLLNFVSKSGTVGNIGIMKFFNKKFLNDYIERYNEVRDVAMAEEETLYPFPRFSVLLGQLLLRNVADDFNYSIGYSNMNEKNEYKHLSGHTKYKQHSLLDRRIAKKTTL